MLYKDICRTLALYLWMLMIPLLIPFGIAIYCEWIAGPEIYPQQPAAFAFFSTLVITAILATLLQSIGRKGKGLLYRKEALLLVIIVWFLTSGIGALPFWINGTFDNPIDAYFETASGFTTTGATVMEAKNYDNAGKEIPISKTFYLGKKITYSYWGTITPVKNPKTGTLLTGIEAVSPSLLFWRSMTQWLGGCGIIVLFVAVLPALGVGGKILYQTEITGPSKESLAPRIKETASQLWKIYLGLTLLQILLLMLTNSDMALFDATTVAFSTISTGGFAPKNASVAAYNSAYTDWIVIVFMILGSISFSMYFFFMKGKFKKLNDPELKLFLIIVLITSLFAAWQLFGREKYTFEGGFPGGKEGLFNFWEALRYGAFQIVSAQTSTGFATANFDLWPYPIQTTMLILMFVGGMAGSTAGGLKVIRLQMFFWIMVDKIEQIFRPDSIRRYRVGNIPIDSNIATNVLTFFTVALSITMIGTFILVLTPIGFIPSLDPETSLTSMACFLNNVGLAFRLAGPTGSFAFLPGWEKALASFWMIAGRLEYFAILVLFIPAYWKSR